MLEGTMLVLDGEQSVAERIRKIFQRPPGIADLGDGQDQVLEIRLRVQVVSSLGVQLPSDHILSTV